MSSLPRVPRPGSVPHLHLNEVCRLYSGGSLRSLLMRWSKMEGLRMGWGREREDCQWA